MVLYSEIGFYGKRVFVGVIKVMDLDVGQLSAIFLVDPNWLHEFLNADNYDQRDECMRWMEV